MDQPEFAKLLRKIVKAGATPVSVCGCGYGIWMFEGIISEAHRRHTEPCNRCGSTEKALLGDFREDLL